MEFTLSQATFGAASVPVALSPSIKVQVRGENGIGAGNYCSPITFTNPAPAAPTGLDEGTPSGWFYPDVTWLHDYADDLEEFRIYVAYTDGFTPGPSNLSDTKAAPSNSTEFTLISLPAYWRVEAVDKWGNTTMSAQATIS